MRLGHDRFAWTCQTPITTCSRAGVAERLAEYPWSSYRALAYGGGCAPWFDRGRVLDAFWGSPAGFRQAVQAYSEEKERVLESLRHGFFLGSLEACGRFLERAGLRVDAEQPQSQRLGEPASVEEAVEAQARRLGISRETLERLRRPLRGRERPQRDILIHLAWQAGHFPLKRIGAYFGVGYTAVANARGHGARHLRRNTDSRRAASNDK